MAGANHALRVTDGNANGAVLPVAETIVLGRAEQGTGNLGGDPQMSSQHARIYEHQDWLVVQDLGSTNGTWVNGRRIGEPTYLQPGDKVVVGGTTLEVESASGAGGGTVIGAAGGGTMIGEAPTTPLPAVSAPLPPPPPPLPVTGAPTTSGGGNRNAVIAAAVAAGVLVIGGIVALVLVLSGGDDTKDNPPVATTTVPAQPKPPAQSTPATPPTPSTPSAAPTPTPPAGGGDNEVSAENRQNIQNVIDDFQGDALRANYAEACTNAATTFSIEGQITDCVSWVAENITNDRLSYDSFSYLDDGTTVAVGATNTASLQRFAISMDSSTGTWLIADISAVG
jgi:hypothetical protein